jgi:phosphoribosylformylglycinamidine cyclo-ligase
MIKMPPKNVRFTYKNSGVNIDAGNQLVKNISPIIASTKRPGSNPVLGGFGGIFDLKELGLKDPLLISATDGVGTKLKFAFVSNNHKTIGIDLVAMCVNDIIAQGAEPLYFLDYFATGKLDTKIAEEVILGIANGCKEANCALIGGETAELPGMYHTGHYDLAGFSVGAVERNKLLPKKTKDGDCIVGLKSSGIHSNGYSLVNSIVEKKQIDTNEAFDRNNKLIDMILKPTRIYVNTIKAIMDDCDGISAIAHITGGGITENLPRVIDKGMSATLDLNRFPNIPIFEWISNNAEIQQEEMLKTFNCGIGMILIVKKDFLKIVMDCIEKSDDYGVYLGKITQQETESQVIYNGTLPWL